MMELTKPETMGGGFYRPDLSPCRPCFSLSGREKTTGLGPHCLLLLPRGCLSSNEFLMTREKSASEEFPNNVN